MITLEQAKEIAKSEGASLDKSFETEKEYLFSDGGPELLLLIDKESGRPEHINHSALTVSACFGQNFGMSENENRELMEKCERITKVLKEA